MNGMKKIGDVFRVRKHRVFIIVCALTVLLFATALSLMTYRTAVTPALTPQNEIVMHNGDELRQELIAVNGDLKKLRISFYKPDVQPQGNLLLSLYRGEQCLQEWTMPAETIRTDNEVFKVTQDVAMTGQADLYMVLRAELSGESEIRVRTSDREDFGTLSLNGQVQDQQTVVYDFSYSDAKAKQIDLFHIGMCALLGLVLIAVAYVLLYTKLKKEWLFAALTFVIGLAFMVSITPLSAPDEFHHYHSSYWLSNYMMFKGDTAELGNSHDFDYHDLKPHYNVPDAYLRVLAEFGEAAPEGGELIDIPDPRKLTYFVQYLPQATGITIGRLLGRNMITNFMLGRFFNLLFYTVCVFLAVKRVPKFQVPLGIVAMLPMALHQASSFSYDTFVNGLALLLIAALVNLLLTDDKVKIGDLVFIGVVAALLAPAKVIYCPLLLLLFLVKKERFGSMKRKLLSIACVLLVCVLMIALIQLPTMMEMGSRGETKLNQYGKYNYTASYALRHPIETAKIFIRSFYQEFFLWLHQAIGSKMSGLTMEMPAWISVAFMFVLMLAVINKPKHSVALRRRDRAVLWGLILMISALVMASMFVAWTSNNSDLVQGIQGRYFIPLLPLLVLAVANYGVKLEKSIDRELIFVSTGLSVTTVSMVLEQTISR